MRVPTYRIGAISYALWGAIHVGAGIVFLAKLHAGGAHAALALVGSAVPLGQIPEIPAGVGMGVLYQHGWNLTWFGLFALYVGLKYNWHNSRAGYWANLAVVSGADIGFLGGIVIPGYSAWLEASAGPLTWIVGVIFTTLGILQKSKPAS